MASMHRSAEKDIMLPNSIKIRKGEHIAISSHRMWDAAEYSDPETFDGYRYVKRRQQPGMENKSLLVSTSPDHLGFAHGKHACPGRFFAANEVKIAMVHILLNYDMKLVDPKHALWGSYGVALFTNPEAKLMVKKRQPEISLDDAA